MKNARTLTKQAMIAALYTVIGMALAPITFAGAQARVSEALTLLPVFGPVHIIGVTLGCLLTNILGFFTGANILGAMDIIFGTAATLIAAVMTYMFRNIRFKGLPILSAIPPIIVNAVVIGLELCFMMTGGFNWVVFLTQAVSVGLGQLLSCFVIGLALVKIIEKNPRLKELIEK